MGHLSSPTKNKVSTNKALKPYGSVISRLRPRRVEGCGSLHILTGMVCIGSRIRPMPLECVFRLTSLRGHSVKWRNILGCEIGTAMDNSRRCPSINDIWDRPYTYQYGISYMI